MSLSPITVYGAEWCADCHRSRSLLDSLNLNYDYKDIDASHDILQEMLQHSGGKNIIPTIILADGTMLQEPSNQALEIALGRAKEEPVDIPTHDVIIIGAGPAALTAAVYTTREDIDTLLFERGVIGGLAAVTDKVDNYPGFPNGIEGLTLAGELQKQAERFGAVIELGEVTAIHDEGPLKRLETTSGEMYAKAVLIATGSDYRKINVPGELEYYARGVHYCATCDGAFYRDKDIAVVGGGNSAIQESIFLTRFAHHIDLLVRSSVRASEVLQHDLEPYIVSGKITLHLQTKTDEILGENNSVTGVKVTNRETNEQSVIKTDGVFVFVGLDPNSQFLSGSSVKCDEFGFVLTDNSLQTSVPGVFAAGDIRSGATMQIASATGEGATAALKIREYLEGIPHPVQN